jgi:hypothetical protein
MSSRAKHLTPTACAGDNFAAVQVAFGSRCGALRPRNEQFGSQGSPCRPRPESKGTKGRETKAFTADCGNPGAPQLNVGIHRLLSHAILQNDLEIFRLRGRDREIVTAPGPGDAFLVIVIQRWSPASPDPMAGAGAGLPAGTGMAAVSAMSATTGAGAAK